MSRRQYPDDQDRSAVQGAGAQILITTDEAGKVPADIVTYPGGGAVAGSILTLDANSLLPYFLSPDPDPGSLFGHVVGDPKSSYRLSPTPSNYTPAATTTMAAILALS